MTQIILAQANSPTTATWIALAVTVILLIACVVVLVLFARWVMNNLFK